MPPLTPPPPNSPEVPQASRRDSETTDCFEAASGSKNSSLITKLREENEILRARVAELEEKLASTASAPSAANDTLDAVQSRRFEILNAMAQVQRDLDLAQKQHTFLLKTAEDPEAISLKAAEMKKPKLFAKKALQNEAGAFEEQTIKPLAARYNELQYDLAQCALRLTKVTKAVSCDASAIVSEFNEFLLKDPENRVGANGVREGAINAAVNPKPGLKPRDLKEVLRPRLTKFFEGKRPSEFSLDEWVHYLGSLHDETSKAVLQHFGVNLESVLVAAEKRIAQSKDWMEPYKGFRLIR